MKLKKTILGLAVVAVAGVNAWLANDVRLAKNELSLVNLENVADAQEVKATKWSGRTTGCNYPADTYTCPELQLVSAPNSGSDSHWVWAIVYYLYCDCDDKTDRYCEPYTKTGYTIQTAPTRR